MKRLLGLIFLLSLTSCLGQIKESNERKESIDIKTKTMIINDSLQKPKDAFQMNMGFDDAPVWIWVKFDKYFLKGKNEFKHIYGINFWDKDGFLYKGYYEQDRELKNNSITNFSNFIINRYPGDKTFQLINKESDTIYLFNVLENKEYRRDFKGKSFQRIPTVKLNKLKQKVSGFDIELNVKHEMNDIYLITIIDSNGIKKNRYKSNCELGANFSFSYFDVISSRIYLLKKDCYLEKIE